MVKVSIRDSFQSMLVPKLPVAWDKDEDARNMRSHYLRYVTRPQKTSNALCGRHRLLKARDCATMVKGSAPLGVIE